jgi:hypothetical protein
LAEAGGTAPDFSSGSARQRFQKRKPTARGRSKHATTKCIYAHAVGGLLRKTGSNIVDSRLERLRKKNPSD